MKHKTWFRLVLKAIGILLIGLSIREGTIFVWALALQIIDGMAMDWGSYMIGYGVGHGLSLALGMYLFFDGEWLVNYVIPSNRDYCPNCGYDVSESPLAKRCSECGAILPADDTRTAPAPPQPRPGTDE
jgi:hypothetical protein